MNEDQIRALGEIERTRIMLAEAQAMVLAGESPRKVWDVVDDAPIPRVDFLRYLDSWDDEE